jgi:hypothetical protein
MSALYRCRFGNTNCATNSPTGEPVVARYSRRRLSRYSSPACRAERTLVSTVIRS